MQAISRNFIRLFHIESSSVSGLLSAFSLEFLSVFYVGLEHELNSSKKPINAMQLVVHMYNPFQIHNSRK